MSKQLLSKRLMSVANMIEPTAFLADVGCDHGFLTIYLVKKGLVSKAVCTDINEGPLQRAAEHISDFRLEDRITTLLSDGLTAYESEETITACTICGMGGFMGIKILYDSDNLFRKMDYFILQLQSDLDIVRLYLDCAGYVINNERITFEDGKYYIVMKVYASCEPKLQFESYEEALKVLRRRITELSVEEAIDFHYPYYEGSVEKEYGGFLEFMIGKYKGIREGMPLDSDRLPEIEKMLDIMNLAYKRHLKGE